jgi:hypothetical protein
MRTSNRIVQFRQSRLILSISALVCITSATDAAAATSELDSFEAAVTSQDKRAALAFIDEFPSSHLVGDLIELLRPEVAHEVCADLPSSARSALDACKRLDVRFAIPQTASEEPEPIPSREPAMEPEPLQSSAQDAAAEAGISDTAMSPAAGPAPPAQELASTTSRSRGTTGERSASPISIPLLPRLADNTVAAEDDKRAKRPAPKEEPEKAPKKKQKDDPAPPAPSLGSDPGSDPGSAPSPSSGGSDPGSDPGSDSGGNAGKDSHH